MNQKLLTNVLIKLVKEKIKGDSYGVSLLNLPPFDYVNFAHEIKNQKPVELYFLGFQEQSYLEIFNRLGNEDNISISNLVEKAEESRNSGDENIIRVLLINKLEIEKLSSLRYFDEISLMEVYIGACKYAQSHLKGTNSAIENMISAIMRKDIRSMLNFERVLEYLEILVNSQTLHLPKESLESAYKLGLLYDDELLNNPDTETIKKRIKTNKELVNRIGSLDQAERQNIGSQLSKKRVNSALVRNILKYYQTKDVELLKDMNFNDVESALKAINRSKTKTSKTSGSTPMGISIEMIFENDRDKIQEVIKRIEESINAAEYEKHNQKIDISVNGTKITIKENSSERKLTRDLIDIDAYANYIIADNENPEDVLIELEKYNVIQLQEDKITEIYEFLFRVNEDHGIEESITRTLKKFIELRKLIIPFKDRLLDSPMMQVFSEIRLFTDYLKAYEELMFALENDIPKIWRIETRVAKIISSTIIAFDSVYIIGERHKHAILSSINPMYLWKYIKLSEEILDSMSLQESESNFLNLTDKDFIMRKVESIPDPLSIMLVSEVYSNYDSRMIPHVGRINNLPVFSNSKSIYGSEKGLPLLSRTISKFLFLYPHSSSMLRIALIDPPSLEAVSQLLKEVERMSEYEKLGIELTIYKTKETSDEWYFISDNSLNDGMIGKYRGKNDLIFRINVIHEKKTDESIIRELQSKPKHIVVMFDPNDSFVGTTQFTHNNTIHPLCVPKVYEYEQITKQIKISESMEGGVFSDYAKVVARINDQLILSTRVVKYSESNVNPHNLEEYINNTVWFIAIDENLKGWEITSSLQEQQIYFKDSDGKALGVYTNQQNKFIQGYTKIISEVGNFIADESGMSKLVSSIRSINSANLLNTISQQTNSIFDINQGKGALGLGIAGLIYERKNIDNIVVGLDTQLAREWISERETNRLPDLIGFDFSSDDFTLIDVIEVKTYQDFTINDETISGDAIEQINSLKDLINEMFTSSNKVTTIARREVLREQIFDTLFSKNIESKQKAKFAKDLNAVFSRQRKIQLRSWIYYVDFKSQDSSIKTYKSDNGLEEYNLYVIGSRDIQLVITDQLDELWQFGKPMNLVDDSIVTKEEEAIDIKTDKDKLINLQPDNKEKENGRDIELFQNNNAIDIDVKEKCKLLNRVLKDYGIRVIPLNPELVQITPRFTRFKMELNAGETIRSIERYKNDIKREMAAHGDVYISNIDGTKYVGVDISFDKESKPLLLLDHIELLKSSKGKLDVILGQSPDGVFEIKDLSLAPHALIAGTTGSGKTIFLYSVLLSLINQHTSDDLELIIIDPKQTDFVFFKDLPHLRGGEVIVDPERALEIINKILDTDKLVRTKQLTETMSRDIESYNMKNPNNPMKRLVVLIDEYADLVQAAEILGIRKDFELRLGMLLQRVRNIGIHFIIATQRPSASIVTSALKANIPFRISFRLPAHQDSMTILDQSGAEDLLSRGDMLVKDDSKTTRAQGLYISESDLIDAIKKYT